MVGCRALLSIGGDHLQFYPIFNIEWGEPQPKCFQISKLSENQKKGLHQNFKSFFPEFKRRPKQKQKKKVGTKIGRLFSSNLSDADQIQLSDSDANQSQIVGGDADVDRSQIIGRNAVKLLGGIYLAIPPGF